MSKYLILKAERDLKYKEIKLIESQARLLRDEVNLRERLIDNLFEKTKLLMNEAQEIANDMLEFEYKACVENNV